MTNFNQDIFSVVSGIFEKHDREQIRHHPVEPWSSELWDHLRQTGFTAIGHDAALKDHAAIAKAVGVYAVALPLVDVGLARWISDSAGLDVPFGKVMVSAGTEPLEGRQIGTDALAVSGTARRVPWGRYADLLVAPVNIEGNVRWATLDRVASEVREGVNFASEPRDSLQFNDAVVPLKSVGSGNPSLLDVHARSALLRCASGLGSMEFALDTSLNYAEQRFQFGKPISAFQTVQHNLVVIAEAVASVMSAVDSAVSAPPELRMMMVAAAKVMFGEQVTTMTRLAHQVHGAIGAADEHPLQLRTRRLWSWQDEFGTTTDWAIELADRLIFPESPGAWPVIAPPLAELASRGVGETTPW